MKSAMRYGIVCGAQKAGTTYLFKNLAAHPDVAVPTKKELNYFVRDGDLSIDDYLNSFPARQHASICCEASPRYMFRVGVAKKIADLIPNAKIIIVLRNPIERAVSAYKMERRRGREDRDIADALFSELCSEPVVFSDKSLMSSQYLALSQYHQPVNDYLRVFGRNAVLILFTEDLEFQPKLTAKRLAEFLEIDFSGFGELIHQRMNQAGRPKHVVLDRVLSWGRPIKPWLPKYILRTIFRLKGWNEAPVAASNVDEELRVKMIEFLRADVVALEKTIGEKVPWLDFA